MALNERKYDHGPVIDMWCDGATSAQIADKLGLSSPEAVRTIVLRERKRGNPALVTMPKRTGGGRRKGRKIGSMAPVTHRILNLWAAGHGSRAIAGEVGRSQQAVLMAIRYHRGRGDRRAAPHVAAPAAAPVDQAQPAMVSAPEKQEGRLVRALKILLGR